MKSLLAAAALIALPALAAAPHDGQHDFDGIIGTWRTNIRRLQHPLSGSKTWVTDTGAASIRPLWNGLGNLEEIEIDTPDGHLEGATVRLYNAQSHQWSLTWINAKRATPDKPAFGEFHDGRGEFIDQEPYDGRMILVRQIYSNIRANSHHFEQAFSADHGRTWETMMIAELTRIEPVQVSRTDGPHDFDFNAGTWKAEARRLEEPLSGSTKWVPGASTNRVTSFWGGRGSIEEMEIETPRGVLREATLRLYNAATQQWSLSWINAKRAAVDPPMFGEFRNGRAEFFDQESNDGRMILVRQTFSDIRPDSYHFEQAFSVDGGKTWEVNLSTVMRRVRAPS